MSSALDGCLKKRRRYRLLYSLHSLVIASCLTDTDVSDSLVCHDCLHICKVKVDQSRQIDQVCDTLYCLLKNFISLTQCFRHGCSSVNDLK